MYSVNENMSPLATYPLIDKCYSALIADNRPCLSGGRKLKTFYENKEVKMKNLNYKINDHIKDLLVTARKTVKYN